MKFFVIFTLALAIVSAFDLRNGELKQRNVSVMENEGRITNGHNANVGQLPYQVGLKLTKGDKSLFWCGGTLISNDYVLTAAHCVLDKKSATIYLGATERTSPEKEIMVGRANFIVHEDYNIETKQNDMALIKFPAITFTNRIRPVALNTGILCDELTLVGKYAVSSGWGRTVENGTLVRNLQYTVNMIITNEECLEKMKSRIYNTNICISTFGGSSPCAGDIGGPLVTFYGGYLVGVYSFGSSRGCTVDYPAVFGRVACYMDWLSKYIDILP